jgi:hypothetical protein
MEAEMFPPAWWRRSKGMDRRTNIPYLPPKKGSSLPWAWWSAGRRFSPDFANGVGWGIIMTSY